MLFQIINQVLNMEYVVNLNNIQHTSHHQYHPTEASVDPHPLPPPNVVIMFTWSSCFMLTCRDIKIARKAEHYVLFISQITIRESLLISTYKLMRQAVIQTLRFIALCSMH